MIIKFEKIYIYYSTLHFYKINASSLMDILSLCKKTTMTQLNITLEAWTFIAGEMYENAYSNIFY